MAIDEPYQEAAAQTAHDYKGGWFTVWMIALVAVMSQIDRGVLQLFVQPIKRDFHMSDVQVSFLLGFAFTIFYVVGGPPISRAADRGVRRTLISSCLAVWSVATSLCTIAQGFWGFFAARAVIGGSESGCGPASLSMISDAVPREKLPLAYAIYNSGFIGGSSLSLLIGGVLIGALAPIGTLHVAGIGVIHSWQLVFLVLGIPGLLISALFLITVKEPRRKGGTRPKGYAMREVIGFIWSHRAMHIPFLLATLLMSFQLYGLQAWGAAFYERTYGWGPAKYGPIAGTMALITTVTGLFLGARVTEWLGKRHDDANMRMYFLCHVVTLPIFIVGPLMPSPWLALACTAIGGVIGGMGGPAYNAALQVATPNEMRSQINALYFVLMNAIAGSLGPTLVALVTDYVLPSEANIRYALVGFRIVLGPISAFLLWLTIAPYRRLYQNTFGASDHG